MSRLLESYVRVSRSRLCPVCERADWCMVSRDEPPSRALCQRVESNKKFGDAGWLHVLIKGDKPNGIKVPVKKTEANEPCIDFSGLARECMKAVNAQRLAALADGLGISIGSLRRL